MHVAMAMDWANWRHHFKTTFVARKERKGLKVALLCSTPAHTHTTGVVSYSAELALFVQQGAVALKERRGDERMEKGEEEA